MKRLLSCLVVLPIFLVGSCGNSTTAQQEPLSSQAPAPTTREPAISRSDQKIQAKPIQPQAIHILGVTAPITPVALKGTELIPPSDPNVLGWWGKQAGSAQGTTLLVGHTVHTGGGTLDNLEDVSLGSVLVMQGWSSKSHSAKAYQKLQYRVISNRIISKPQLAQRASYLFSQSGLPKLVVVTCEDYNWSTGEYASNVVLIAEPI